jgi:hypothetical protein
VRHLFSFYPFYFDLHSARIIFDVSSGLADVEKLALVCFSFVLFFAESTRVV